MTNFCVALKNVSAFFSKFENIAKISFFNLYLTVPHFLGEILFLEKRQISLGYFWCSYPVFLAWSWLFRAMHRYDCFTPQRAQKWGDTASSNAFWWSTDAQINPNSLNTRCKNTTYGRRLNLLMLEDNSTNTLTLTNPH